MIQPEFEKLSEDFLSHCKDIRTKKGVDYSEESDCLANFKVDAELIGTTKYQQWFTHANKHYRAVTKFVKRGQTESEPIKERIADEINYLLLLNALITEDEKVGTL